MDDVCGYILLQLKRNPQLRFRRKASIVSLSAESEKKQVRSTYLEHIFKICIKTEKCMLENQLLDSPRVYVILISGCVTEQRDGSLCTALSCVMLDVVYFVCCAIGG